MFLFFKWLTFFYPWQIFPEGNTKNSKIILQQWPFLQSFPFSLLTHLQHILNFSLHFLLLCPYMFVELTFTFTIALLPILLPVHFPYAISLALPKVVLLWTFPLPHLQTEAIHKQKLPSLPHPLEVTPMPTLISFLQLFNFCHIPPIHWYYLQKFFQQGWV